MERIKSWYNDLTPQWKATLRTALQNVLGAISIFVVAMFASLTSLLSGDTVDLVQDASNAARLSLVALLSVASGLWAYVMNRSKAEPNDELHGGARGDSLPPVRDPGPVDEWGQ